jgi:plasmid stabilization system protein ParE
LLPHGVNLAQVAFYEKEEPGLGARFSVEVEDATARAVAYPLSGSSASKNARRVLVKGFPFSVVYRPTDDGVTVFAVAHSSRSPAYWLPRVQDADELACAAIASA